MVRGARWGSIGLLVEASSFSSHLGVLSRAGGGCLRVTGAAMYLGMASSKWSRGRSLHRG
ncbi:UNVERIFIED_CONTAM: hypothetical protein Slati_2769200 [Sesamum latifolium]|uniref:Uncharacterized protein n=1 Tax=Sesamum latifolium TaxID=2727402 RepID=A0AAW2VXC1_9LAMI